LPKGEQLLDGLLLSLLVSFRCSGLIASTALT